MRILALSCAAFVLAACGDSGAKSPDTPASLQSLPALSGEYVWTLDAEKSSVTYVAGLTNSEFTGGFDSFVTAIRLNPNDLSTAEITAIIDIASGNAGNSADRNDWFPSDEWMDTKSYPQAVFKSSTVRHIDGNAYEADGTLTLKGVTKPLTLPFTLEVDERSARAKAQIRLNRIDYNIGKGLYNSEADVKFAVNVMVDITARR